MGIYNTKSNYDTKLELRAYASQSASTVNGSSVEIGPLRAGMGLLFNIGAVASTGTIYLVLKASTDDSTFVDLIQTQVYTAAQQIFIPVGPAVDSNGDSYKYFKVTTVVANAAISHGCFIA